jgi:hypothetical protein
MSTRPFARIDARAASVLAAAGCLVAAACSPGAPATESGANVAEFSTIPGVTGVPANEPPAVAAAGDEGSAAASGGAEGNPPVSAIDAPSPPGAPSSDEPTSDEGSSGVAPTPSTGEPAAGGEPPGSGDGASASEPETGEMNSETCGLEVTVTTAPHGGRYTPRNVGAIWVADATGAYVKSLDVWGDRRLSHVEAWNAATRAAGVPGDRVDAVTGATQATHRAHLVSWDCTNHLGEPVPDGSYRVYFEVTEANAAGPNHFETFEKGPTAATLQASAPSFADIALSFTP